MSDEKSHSLPEDRPPIFKGWKVLYLIVLSFHALMIILFSWLTAMFQ